MYIASFIFNLGAIFYGNLELQLVKPRRFNGDSLHPRVHLISNAFTSQDKSCHKPEIS